MAEKIQEAPLEFVPFFKSVIWGGNSIYGYKGLHADKENVGESWEISEVPGHVSIVADGEYKGKSLSELITRFGSQLLGEKVMKKYDGKFPLLIKFIDAKDNLSLQVHPDDALALKRHGSLGKTEMWYIINTDKNAKICAGLKKEITPQQYEQSVKDGSFMDNVAIHDSAPGDVFFLPAGRVHGIGAGNLLAEIQESSDVTYRIYDYDRKDVDGNPRELHIDAAKDAIDFKVYDNYKEPPADMHDPDVLLVENEHFKTRRIIVDKDRHISLPDDSFTVLICIEGEIIIKTGENLKTIKQGQTFLLPAVIKGMYLSGKGILLCVDNNPN